MKKFLIALSLVSALSAGAKESYYPDEIHGSGGLINNTAVNSYGAILILDAKTKIMSILLRENSQVGPLVFKKDGKETYNTNAFVPKKITSNRWSFKSFGPNGQVFINLTGHIKQRKEGVSMSYEIVMYNGSTQVEKETFDTVWNLYVESPKMVIEIEVDGYPIQLNFVR
jgi:hypothetical protein